MTELGLSEGWGANQPQAEARGPRDSTGDPRNCGARPIGPPDPERAGGRPKRNGARDGAGRENGEAR